MKKILLVLVILSVSLNLQAQVLKNNKSWILDYEPLLQTSPETNVVYQGRDFVRLSPGFKYSSTGTSNHFIGRINDNLICTTIYKKQEDCDNTNERNISTELPVGSLTGESNVTPNGAFTYNIPIFTPPGTNGVQPGISLVYNSQSGNGLVGWGWNLSGQSAISRVPQNNFTDNISKEIQFHKTDKLAIDGNRLVEVGGTAGENNTEYFTEVGNTIKVIPHNSSTQGYEWFEVLGKDGSKTEYGHTTDSRVVTSRGVISWLINKVTDKNGNFILYNYLDNEDIKYIHTISYTGNDLANPPLVPYAKVQFIYDERPDKNITYIGGIAMKSNLILAEIKVKFDEKGNGSFNTEKKYSLKYVQNEYPQLYSVTEHSKTGEALNPTIFNYDYENKTELEITVKNIDYTLTGETNSYFGDFNGDGIKDRLVVTRADDYMADWDLLLGQYFDCVQEDCGSIGYQIPINGKYQFTTVDYKAEYGHKLLRENVIVADINNDGFDDLIVPYLDGYSDCFANEDDMSAPFFNLKVNIYTSNSYKLNLAASYHLTGSRLINYANANINEVFIPGDFDGDGYLELIVKTQQLDYYGDCETINTIIRNSDNGNNDYANAWYIDLTYDNGEILQNVSWQQIITGLADEKLQIIPIQAVLDNKAELLVIANESYQGIYQIRNSSGTILWEKVPDIDALKTYNFKSEGRYNTGDFNGDGYTDLLFRDSCDGDKWKIKYWKGNDFSSDYIMTEMGDLEYDRGFYNYQFTLPLVIQNNSDRSKGVFYSLILSDFNGDGKTDILTYDRIDKFSGWDGCDIHINRTSDHWEADHFTIDNYAGKVNYVFDYNETDYKYNLYTIKGVTETVVIYSKLEKNVNNIDRSLDNNYLLVEDIVRHDKWPICQNLPSISDFNGDVNADIFNYSNSGKVMSIYTNKLNTQLKSISEGYGNKTDIIYQVITKPNGVFTGSTNYSYPLRNIRSHIYVTSNVDKFIYKEVSPYLKLSYKYETGLSHINKGFLGFKEFYQINPNAILYYITNNFITKNSFELDEIKYNLNPLSTLIYNTYGQISNEVYNTQRMDLNNNKRYFYYQSDISSYDYLKNTSFFTHNIYDSYENIMEKQVNYKLDDPLFALASIKTEYKDYITAGGWCVSTAKKIIVTKKHQDDGINENVIETNYEYLNNDVKKVYKDLNKTKYSITEFDYNDFGNITKTSISEYPLTDLPREFISTYDSRGRFSISKNNSLGYISTFKFDEFFGKITETKNEKGLSSKYIYDSFGREKMKISSKGVIANISYNWCINLTSPRTMYSIETKQDNTPTVISYFNSLGNELKTVTESFNGKLIFTEKEYFANGKLSLESFPYYINSPKRYTSYWYDDFWRPLEINNNELITIFAYGSQKVTVFTPDNKISEKSYDDLGNIFQSKEREMSGGIVNTVNFKYNCNGKIREINTTQLNTDNEFKILKEYDVYGNQTKLDDEDAGIYQFVYNTLGEIMEKTDPLGNKEKKFYDRIGRIVGTEIKNSDGLLLYTKEYNYVPNSISQGTGSLENVSLFDSNHNLLHKLEFLYDSYSQVLQKDEYVGNEKFSWFYSYNQSGQITNEIYPSGVKISYLYDQNGYLVQVKRTDKTHNDIIWELVELDAFGKPLKYKLADGKILTTNSYNELELPTGILTTIDNDKNGFPDNIVQDLEFVFDEEKAVLTSRKDAKNNQEESFDYDVLCRLTSYEINNNNNPVTLNYSKDGSIQSKSDMGYYYYTDGEKVKPPHGVKKIPEVNCNFNQLKQEITYNAFNRPEELKMVNLNNITQNKAVFSYGYDQNRRKVEYFANGIETHTKYYLGNYEKIVRADNSVKEITYITARGGIVAAIIKGEEPTYPNDEQTLFIHTDYLGSIQSLTRESEVTPGDYEVIAEFAYDPWGRMRFEADWTRYYDNESLHSNFGLLGRGFTGQEHLSDFGLINLNARLYDQSLGRFLNCDPYIQSPESPQNYNRYSYCLNNPLKYSDPNGKLIIPMLAAFIHSYLMNSTLTNNWGGESLLQGAISAAATFSGYHVAKATTNFVQSIGVAQKSYITFYSALGSSLSSTFTSSLLQGKLPGYGQVLSSVLTAATSSQINKGTDGKDFWPKMWGAHINGAVLGGMSAGLTGGDMRVGMLSGGASGIISFWTYWVEDYVAEQKEAQKKAEVICKIDADTKANTTSNTASQPILTYEIYDDEDGKLWEALNKVYVKYGWPIDQLKTWDYDSENVLKFGDMHIRRGCDGLNSNNAYQMTNDSKQINVHYDKIDVIVNPLKHWIRDTRGQQKLGIQ